MLLKIKQDFLDFYERNKHGLILLIYGIFYLVWFRYLESQVTVHYHVIHMAVDNLIPFCELFVIPYLMWFGYVALGIGYFYFHNVRDYYRLCTFLFVGMTVFLIISTLYPNGQHLRPAVFPRDNVFTQIVGWLYSSDTPTNLFPSIHVYNSLGVHIAVCQSRELSGKKGIKTASFILMTAIILSTMFLKQHSVFDVITAFVMAGVMHSLVYGREYRRSLQEKPGAEHV